jgi:hypothetical protein
MKLHEMCPHRTIIYKISHPDSDFVYIGSTTQKLKDRKSQVLSKMRLLYRDTAWSLILSEPARSFKILSLEICDPEKRFESEQYWISHYESLGKLINKSEFACPGIKLKGCTLSEEQIAQRRKLEHSKESIRKMEMNHGRNKRIRCIETGEEFFSAMEAARIYGGRGVYYTRVCDGQRKHYKNRTYEFID